LQISSRTIARGQVTFVTVPTRAAWRFQSSFKATALGVTFILGS
jgi:hypothetical protein